MTNIGRRSDPFTPRREIGTGPGSSSVDQRSGPIRYILVMSADGSELAAVIAVTDELGAVRGEQIKVGQRPPASEDE